MSKASGLNCGSESRETVAVWSSCKTKKELKGWYVLKINMLGIGVGHHFRYDTKEEAYGKAVSITLEMSEKGEIGGVRVWESK